MSSIIKNYRTLQGNVISIGQEQAYTASQTYHETTAVALEEPIHQIDFEFLEKEAKQEALRIVEEAKAKASALLEQATEAIEGQRQQFAQEVSQLRQQLESERLTQEAQVDRHSEAILNEAYLEKEKVLKQAEPEIVELVTTLLHKIIDQKIISSKEWLTLFVRQVVEKEHIQEAIKVSMHPEVLNTHGEALQTLWSDLPVTITLEADSSFNQSTCSVSMSTGTILYDLQKGLTQVMDEMHLLCTEG